MNRASRLERVGFWLSLAGALLSVFQGWRWLIDMSSDLAALAAQILGPPPWAAGIALVVAGMLGLTAATLTALGKGRPRLQDIALVALGLLPLVFSMRAVFATPMALGALLRIVASHVGAGGGPVASAGASSSNQNRSAESTAETQTGDASTTSRE